MLRKYSFNSSSIGRYFKSTELKDFCKKAGIECGKKDEMISSIKKYLKKYLIAPRYLRGLTDEEKWVKRFEIRYNTLKERAGVKKSYEPSKIDYKYRMSGKKTVKRKQTVKKSRKPKSKKISRYQSRGLRQSRYTAKWNKKYEEKSLTGKSKRSGVPVSILKKVYNKGLAAWRGGAHRPGASQQSWAVARVNSFLTCGKTFYFPDHLLAKEAMKKSPKAKAFWNSQKCKFSKMGKRSKSR